MMRFLEKVSNDTYILQINIKPNSKRQKIIDNDEFLTILVKSPPIQNKANIELINILKKKLEIASSQIKIVSGLKSTNKSVQIKFLREIEKRSLINRLFN